VSSWLQLLNLNGPLPTGFCLKSYRNLPSGPLPSLAHALGDSIAIEKSAIVASKVPDGVESRISTVRGSTARTDSTAPKLSFQ